MIGISIISDRYNLQVDYFSREEITVIFVKDFCGVGEQKFQYECSHYLDTVGHILKFKDYFEDAEFDRFYKTVLALIE